MFSTLSKTEMTIFVTFNLSSANTFNLVSSEILSSGNGLSSLVKAGIIWLMTPDRHFPKQTHLYKCVNEICKNSLLEITFMCHTMSNWYSCCPNYIAPERNTSWLYLWKQSEICPSDHVRITWWGLHCLSTLRSWIFHSGSGMQISRLNIEICTGNIHHLVFLSISRDFRSIGTRIIAAPLLKVAI